MPLRPASSHYAVYRTALPRLPPLTRTLFLLHRERGLSYREIAANLVIDTRAVEGGIAEALYMLATMLRGNEPQRMGNRHLSAAETILDRRHAERAGSYLESLLADA